MPRGANNAEKCEQSLRKLALSYPESHEDFPWGHRALKVRKKIFLTLGSDDGEIRATVKLRESQVEALLLPYTEPTHYGMGKHGWVTAKIRAPKKSHVELLQQWIDESYRLIAPKRLVKQLPEVGPPRAGKTGASKATKPKVDKAKAGRGKNP